MRGDPTACKFPMATANNGCPTPSSKIVHVPATIFGRIFSDRGYIVRTWTIFGRIFLVSSWLFLAPGLIFFPFPMALSCFSRQRPAHVLASGWRRPGEASDRRPHPFAARIYLSRSVRNSQTARCGCAAPRLRCACAGLVTIDLRTARTRLDIRPWAMTACVVHRMERGQAADRRAYSQMDTSHIFAFSPSLL